MLVGDCRLVIRGPVARIAAASNGSTLWGAFDLGESWGNVKVKAAVWYGGKDIRIEHVPKPKAGLSDALVRVRAVGICGSDMHAYEGPSRRTPPLVMGHEFAGTVEEVGVESRDGLGVGDRVVANPSVNCGVCEECRQGRTNICRAHTHLGVNVPGAFAEYVRVPARLCYRISDPISFEEAALAEPLSVGMHVRDVAKFADGDTVLILGAGIIGLSCLIGAKQKVERVMISDVLDSRLEFARLFGADSVINAGATDTVREIQRITSGRGVDVAIDAVGVELTIRQAVSSSKQAGRVVLVGNLVENAQLSILEITSRELQLNGSYGRTDSDFKEALKLLEEGQPNIRRLITQTFPLDHVSEAFEFSCKQKEKSIKVLLLP